MGKGIADSERATVCLKCRTIWTVTDDTTWLVVNNQACPECGTDWSETRAFISDYDPEEYHPEAFE
jgi:hypothetical protein